MNGWETLTFCEDLGRQIHDPFLLAISRGQFCEPRTGFVKNSRTAKKRPNIVRNVTHKSSAIWESCVACGARHETDIYCAINTGGPRMTMDLPARDLSLVYQLFSETYTWIHDHLSYLQTMFI